MIFNFYTSELSRKSQSLYPILKTEERVTKLKIKSDVILWDLKK